MANATEWHPVIPGASLRKGVNVVGSRLLGRNLALWRSADGVVRVWDDRCPHRSVRLSMGQVQGDRLACAYHGWAYAADSGRCVAIPAMPHQAVPGQVCTTRHGAAERDGMVWVALDAPDAPAVPEADQGASSDAMASQWLRTLAIRVGAASLQSTLAARGLQQVAAHTHRATLASGALHLFVQSCDAGLTMVHAWLSGAVASGRVEPALLWLRELRTSAEQASR